MKIPIVNEKDEVLCYKERGTEEQMDLYRTTGLWLTNSNGEVLLARRALDKAHDPGIWGPAAAGTVEKGETYESNIIKEVKEELDLEVELKKSIKIKRFSKERPHNYLTQWFTAKIDISAKEINFDKVEVDTVKWFSKKELSKKVSTNPENFLTTIKEFVKGKISFENELLKTTEFIQTKSFKIAIYKKGKTNCKKLALLLPGRLDTKDYAHLRSHVDFLATRGYLALSFDPPGTWESEGDISIYSTTNYLKAIKEIIEFYGNKPTLVMGHSRGGSMAILAGTRIDYVKSFIAVMSRATYKTTNFVDDGWKKKGFVVSTRDTPKGYLEPIKSFKLPYSFVEDSQKYDMIEDLKNCSKPKLFVAGSKDVLVKADGIRDAFKLSSKPKQFKLLNSDHDYRKNNQMIEKVNELISEFLKTYEK
jgi:isopentenyl-diphosphate Delta-isomerase